MDVPAWIDRPLNVRISTWRCIYWSVGCSRKWGSVALWGFSSTFKHHAVTRLGALHRNRNQTGTWITVRTTVDASCLHWRPLDESPHRHPALLQNHTKLQNCWVLVRAFKRERVMIIHPGLKTDDLSTEALPRSELKWEIRQDGKVTLPFYQWNTDTARHGK